MNFLCNALPDTPFLGISLFIFLRRSEIHLTITATFLHLSASVVSSQVSIDGGAEGRCPVSCGAAVLPAPAELCGAACHPSHREQLEGFSQLCQKPSAVGGDTLCLIAMVGSTGYLAVQEWGIKYLGAWMACEHDQRLLRCSGQIKRKIP